MVIVNNEALKKGEDIDIVRNKQVQEQEQFNKIRNTKYNRMYKFIGKVGLPGYLEGKGRGESQKLITRASAAI